MKILQIGTYYLPHFGGIEQLEYDLSRILRSQGHETKLICFNETKSCSIDIYEGQEIYRIGYGLKLSSQAISVKYFFILKRLIKSFNPDVIHIHLPNPLIAFYLLILNPKCKISIHWHSDIIKQRVLKKVVKPIEIALLKKSNGIIATSQIYANNSERLCYFLDKVEIIPSIVEDSFLSTLSESEVSRINEIKQSYQDKKIILFMGVHRLYKGITYLINSAQYLNDEYHVIIAGTGPLTEQLKEEVKSLGLKNVSFVGRISEKEKKCYLYAAETFAFPSITKNEALGLALAEALFCGTPAVTFYIEGSGVNWVNKNGISGIEVYERDPKLYAQALMSCSKVKYGAEAKKWAENNFTEKVIYKKVNDFFVVKLKENM